VRSSKNTKFLAGAMFCMACPARFERATYALEAVKMSRNNSLDNSISLAKSGVRSAPRSVVLGGMPWMSGGIGRRLNGRSENLSGKPTSSWCQAN